MKSLVISGGGSKGAYAGGICQYLKESGKDWDFYAGTSTGSLIVPMVACNEIENLKKLWQSFPSEEFLKAVNEILNTKQIFIIGLRGSVHLAHYFGYFLKRVKRSVQLLTTGSASDFEELIEANPKTLVISIAFPRYPQATIELTQYAKAKGTKVISITDAPRSPTVKSADISLVVPVGIITLFDSYSAPMCMINALVTEVGRRNSKQTRQLIDESERLLKEKSVYYSE